MPQARKSPLLPKEDAREAALFFVVAALCFLAALTGLATRAAYGAAESWAGQVQGEVTIRLLEGGEETSQSLANLVVELPGVLSAEPENRQDTERLLVPWLGENLPEDLPVSRYIAVQIDPSVPDMTEQIRDAAEGAGFQVEVEDHELWARDVERSLGILRLIGLVALGLLVTIVVSVIAFATHAALLARRDVVNVLHTCGASDRFISRLFEYRFFGLGLRAGILGALFALFGAMLLFFAAKQSGDRSWLLPQMSPDLGTFLVLIITPFISALVAMIAARLTVTRALGELS
ncbi:MAG: cell division protein FtsX [Ponticaulis sp.]|nr:cell division protein FtsX [Ponticaulis sp.]|tara:strand:- start:34824 stop:35696 length:873 start_codon:yes stop_codon:yes gene_type:complete